MSNSIECDPDRLLLTVASVISERVQSMQQAVDRIAGFTMERGKPSPEMVVTFQAFDRLTQEFEALGSMLRTYAEASANDREDKARAAIAALHLSELKNCFAGPTISPDIQNEDDVLTIGAAEEGGYKVF